MIPLPLLIIGVVVGLVAFIWWSETRISRRNMADAIRKADQEWFETYGTIRPYKPRRRSTRAAR